MNIFDATPTPPPQKPSNTDSKALLGQTTNARLNIFQSNGNSWNPAPAPTQPEDDPSSAPALEDATIKGLPSAALNMGKGFLKGVGKFVKSAVSSPYTLATGGKTAQGTYERDAANTASDVIEGKAPLRSALKPIADTVGEGGTILTAADPEIAGAAKSLGEKAVSAVSDVVPGLVKEATSAASDIYTSGKNLAGKTFIGKDGLATLKQLGDKEAAKFLPEAQGGTGKTFSNVVENVNGAVNKFVSDSKSALQAVKDKIPDVAVDTQKVFSKLNEGIQTALKSSAKYKGVDIASDATTDNLIKTGVIKPEEVPTVKSIVNTVKGWGDFSARGVLNLKEALADYYTEGATGSNKVLSNVQDGLKDLVGEASKGAGVDIKGALETASGNIDTAEKFTKNLVGKTASQGESKLTGIARALSNPAAKGEQASLLSELKNATGYDATPELKGYNNFLKLLKGAGNEVEGIPSKVGVITSKLVKRLGITAAAGGGAAELYSKVRGD